MNTELEKRLENIKIENGEIELVEFVKERVPSYLGITFACVPDYCRVCVKLYPSAESNILVELWLPIYEWNGNFLGTGNGGFGGSINPLSLATGASKGYAVANTDMGTSGGVDELINKPERWIDFGYRATHLMTTVSKKIIKSFYGEDAKHSYFMGSSTGGQQALMEAQRYPEDYDGIIVSSPAHNRVRLHTSFVWNWQALTRKEDGAIDSHSAETITRILTKKYAEMSGSALGDNFISYPAKIKIDKNIFAELKDSLTLEQINALEKIYAGPVNPVTKEKMFTSYSIGSENGWLGLARQSNKEDFAQEFFYLFRWIFGKDFNFEKFDFNSDFSKAVEILSPILDAIDTNLSRFKARGGKIIMLSGSADPIIPCGDTTDYYKDVVEKQGGIDETKSFFRYFLVPGLGHTFGGPGLQDIGLLGLPDVPKDKKHDVLSAISAWVENGEAPDILFPVAFEDSKLNSKVAFERPVFPYPYITEYISGDPKNPDNFRKKLDPKAY